MRIGTTCADTNPFEPQADNTTYQDLGFESVKFFQADLDDLTLANQLERGQLTVAIMPLQTAAIGILEQDLPIKIVALLPITNDNKEALTCTINVPGLRGEEPGYAPTEFTATAENPFVVVTTQDNILDIPNTITGYLMGQSTLLKSELGKNVDAKDTDKDAKNPAPFTLDKVEEASTALGNVAIPGALTYPEILDNITQ